jgi:hypothetical protein
VLEELGHKETSIHEMDAICQQIRQSMPPKSFDTLEERLLAMRREDTYALDSQLADRLIRLENIRRLTLMTDRIEQVIARHQEQPALKVIEAYLTELTKGKPDWQRLGLTQEEMVNLEARFSRVKTAVAEAWNKARDRDVDD